MKIAQLAFVLMLGCSAVPTPAWAVKTITFERAPATDDGVDAPSDEDGRGAFDDAYDTLANYWRIANIEVAATITVGEQPNANPFIAKSGWESQEQSSLGDFRLPPNTRQMLKQNGNHGLIALLMPSEVPEPSAWTMMIVGLGGVGILLRRRRTAEKRTIAT